jgi:hypothetical protein
MTDLKAKRAFAFLIIGILFASTGAFGKVRRDAHEFSITLERTGCLGTCPDYGITIQRDGSVQYDGRFYVTTHGIHNTRISESAVKGLIRRLNRLEFFQWEMTDKLCLDFPEVKITATLNGKTNAVLGGCNSPRKIRDLAKEIDRISGDQRWVGKAP